MPIVKGQFFIIRPALNSRKFAGVFYKVQSTEFKVHPSPLVLRRDKNFARCAQHNINWIATRRCACSQ